MDTSIDHYITELTKKHALRTSLLNEEQLVEIIKQQILSGDITRHVHLGVYGSGGYQSVAYIPYSGIERLSIENAELRRKLKLVEEALK